MYLAHCAKPAMNGDLIVSALVSVFSAAPRFKCICIAFSAVFSPVSAATTQQRHRGGHTRANRGVQRFQPSNHAAFCVDSAASSVLPARHFSGKIANCADSESKRLAGTFPTNLLNGLYCFRS